MQQPKPLTLIFFLLAGYSSATAQDIMKVQSGATLVVQSGAQMVVQGGVLLDNGSTVTNNGTITLKQNGSSGVADWIDNTVTAYNYGTGKLVLNGTGGHTINTKNSFSRVEVDASGHVNLASDVSAATLLLKLGRINTGINKLIATSPAALAIEEDPANTNFTNSWVNGNLRRFVTPASVNSYTFPVGDAVKVNRAVLENLNASPLNNLTYMDAAFGPKPGTDVGLIVTESGQPYVAVNNGGVWYLTPDVAPTSGAYDALLYFNGFTGLSDNSFAIIKRPNSSSDAAHWISPIGSVLPANSLPGRTVASGYARRNNINSFSQFGIGILPGPLPVTLMSFDAVRLTRQNVKVNWQTLTESNNLGFDIERRFDTEPAFNKIGFAATKAPGGNSNDKLDYEYLDPNGYEGVSYYRLKQIDNNSRFSYTFIKAVRGIGDAQVSVMLFPNPNNGQFAIQLSGVNRTFKGYITDMNGKVVQQVVLSNSNVVKVNGLSAGTYVLNIPDVFGERKAFTEKILVVR